MMVKSFKSVNVGKILFRLFIGIFSLILLYTLYAYFFTPDVSALRNKIPIPTSVMEARLLQLQKVNSKAKLNYHYKTIGSISDNLKLAVIVSEDAAFFDHDGVDWDEIGNSFEKNLKQGKFARGGSTISMQVSKNVYLSLSKNPLRKIQEYFITNEIENQLSKKRILEIYLNIAEWGPNGIFGAESAAKYYFNKSAASLTSLEAAQLAAILPNPVKYSPNSQAKWFKRKVNHILKLMNFYDDRYNRYLEKM